MEPRDHQDRNTTQDLERRGTNLPDTGDRRRHIDYKERQDRQRLVRDWVLLGTGALGVVCLGVASVFVEIKSDPLALGVLGVCATLLGAPTALRFDERKRNGNGNGNGKSRGERG